jgi:hypothetical protein
MRTAMFSILQPGKHLPPHRGPYKGLLRVHLGIDVPVAADASWIEVGGTRLHWQEGKIVVFDDTFVHHAANDASSAPSSSPFRRGSARFRTCCSRSGPISRSTRSSSSPITARAPTCGAARAISTRS